MTEEQDNFHERLIACLEMDGGQQLVEMLASARTADIAESFELLDDEERSRILFTLPPHTAAEVVVMLDEAVRSDVVDDLDTESLSGIVSELQPDDAADVLSELTSEEVLEILEHISDEQSDKIEGLLEYDEETAGGIMTPDVVALSASQTVADAVEAIRGASQEEELHEIYVVDDEQRLIGTVPLRRLVTSDSRITLGEICDRDVVSVLVDDDQETVVQVIRKYDVMSAAVVDRSDRLLGRITHDDLLDVAEEEAAEDLYRMAGTDAAEFETSSVFNAARIRLTWLLPCMAGMLLTASVLKLSAPRFDLALFTALMLFVPMIGAMGGNSGIQISTVIVRGFATGDLGSTKLGRVMAREGRIAMAIAPVCGFTAWALVTVFFPLFQRLDPGNTHSTDSTRVALAVGSGMTTGILVAGCLGIMLPFGFRRLGIDPAIASGPLITTLNDVLSVSVYMLIAMGIVHFA